MDTDVVGLLSYNIVRDLDDFLVNYIDISKDFSNVGKIAVKLHMGEFGNLHYVRPPLVGRLVELLQGLGNEVFLFDTPTLYDGSRGTVEGYYDTARRNGFTEQVIGCPIVISDESVQVPTEGVLEHINIAKHLTDADAIIVLSHGKGHPDIAFGGAIKNLAMGATNKQTKYDLHKKPKPTLGGECTGCRTCENLCPLGAVSVVDSCVQFNYDNCFGCGVCASMCPTKALTQEVTIEELFAETFLAIKNQFQNKPIFYVTVLMDITPRCDCLPVGGTDEGFPICPDVGVLAAYDAQKIDEVSIKLVHQNCGNKLHQMHHKDPRTTLELIKSKTTKTEPYRIYDYQTKRFLNPT
ncbi:MAG: DUF362 domain-containing protein [Candidatus Bathyarchaeota archaeon]|nr:MAG: DUF362 domain-containing protein [Candidatus Bathyarchaeota archaeon]